MVSDLHLSEMTTKKKFLQKKYHSISIVSNTKIVNNMKTEEVNKSTETFVKLYVKHDCLWNPDHDDYRTNFRRQQAYNTMITEYNEATGILLTEREVRSKINTVRVCYTKIIKRGINHLGMFNTKLKWFPVLHECIKQLPKKKLKESSCDDDDENRSSDDIQNVWITPDESDDDDKSNANTSRNNDDYILLLKSESEQIEAGPKQIPFKSRKRKLNYSTDSEHDIKFSESLFKNREDEFDVFGKFIATQLRGLGLKKALSVQLELHDVVRKARLENLP